MFNLKQTVQSFSPALFSSTVVLNVAKSNTVVLKMEKSSTIAPKVAKSSTVVLKKEKAQESTLPQYCST